MPALQRRREILRADSIGPQNDERAGGKGRARSARRMADAPTQKMQRAGKMPALQRPREILRAQVRPQQDKQKQKQKHAHLKVAATKARQEAE